MFSSDNTILVLAPHTDDGELGCGASLSKLHRMGCDIHYVAFCTCDESLPDGYPRGTLARELRHAAAALSIPDANLHIQDFEVRRLSYNRQDVLDILVSLNRELKPDVVFCPTLDDLHQDHMTVAHEALRAFKRRTILAYEMPWNNVVFTANFIVAVEEQDIENKSLALSRYKSQEGRSYMQPSFIRSWATMRGVSVGVEFAEAFTMVRGVSR